MTQTLLVIGACGAQGQSVIEYALKLGSNIKIIALTHRPDCEQAKQLLENPSVELKSYTPLQNQLVSIFKGVDIVYASANDHDPDYHLDNEEFELLFGKEIINSAINANVKHIIWSSLCDSSSPIASFSVKRQLERMLTNNTSKLKWTILYSAFFMENFMKFTPIQITNEAVTLIAPFTPETELHLFDVKDFGIVVKSILSQLDSFSNKKLCLFSERKTVREILQSFSRATQLNKSILLNEQDKNNDYSRELSDVLQWFKSGGYSNLLHSSSTFSSSDLTSLDSWISKNLQHFTSMQSKI